MQVTLLNSLPSGFHAPAACWVVRTASGSLSGTTSSCRQQKQAKRPKQLCTALASPDVRVQDKRKSLLRFVQDVQAHDILIDFQETAPTPVIEAMRTTVTNLLGTLPPSYFEVTTTASVEDMAQIMYSIMMTGYMYRNAQYRLELDHVRRLSDDDEIGNIDFPIKPEALQRLGREETGIYAEGTQLSRVSGDVLRWRKDVQKLEEIPAQNYIQNCEDEIASLRSQVSKLLYQRGSGNELLDFIKVQEPVQLKELTENAGTVIFEAMNSFVQRLIGNSARKVEVNSQELARIFYFILVVGYNLRQLEVKCDFESSFTVSTLSGLPSLD